MSERSIWTRIGRRGLHPDERPGERRRAILANQSAVITALSCAAFATGFWLLGPPFRPLVAANLVVVTLSLVALGLHGQGHRSLAKAAVLVPVHGLILDSSLRLGLAAGTQAYFFLLGAVAFLLFGQRQVVARFAFASLSGLSLLYVLLVAPEHGPLGLDPREAMALNVVSGVAVLGTLVFVVKLFTGDTAAAEASLAQEHARSERLLLNVLPASISARLKNDDHAIADGFADVTVLFADLVGFTELSQRLAPAALVAMLNNVFSKFDDLASSLGLEKIKTIGDCYMVAAGLPELRPDHVEAAARMALGIREALARVNEAEGYGLRLRIGLHTGPVIAGVIGKRKFIYDVWGDTVNTASRMESSGVENEIQVTEQVYRRLAERFELVARGTIQVKGKGALATYFLRGEREPPARGQSFDVLDRGT